MRRSENVAWMTGGAVELRVLTPCETGVASLLVTAAGKRYYFTSENEAPRLHDEEFGALDFEPVLFPWWADDTAAAAAKLAGGRWVGYAGRGLTQVNLAPLRAALSESEIARYRWLGAETAAATVEALHEVEPGLSEYDLEAITEEGLLRRGILAVGCALRRGRAHLQVQACGAAGRAAEAIRDAESLLAEVGAGDFDYAVHSLWGAACGACGASSIAAM
jgi:Xaa-Pro aminopeptidase